MTSRTRMIQVVACDATEEARRAYLNADPRADIVELRLDTIRDLDLDRLIAPPGKPKLLTIRSRQQGGGALPAERQALLPKLIASGADYLDIEPGDERLPALQSAGGPRRVLAHHDLEATPLDLSALYARMRTVPHVSLIKIVTYADTATDVLRIRDLLRTVRDRTLIAFCIGAKGIPSRIFSSLWGSAAIYAPCRGATPTAAGQIPLEELFDIYRFRSIGRQTRLLGVVGNPVGHSLSPLMHNAALAHLKLDYRYLPFEASTLAEFLPLLSELRLAGLSVTLPYKKRIMQHLDRIDPGARRAGAVNTVRKIWNRLEGFNFDVEAAVRPLRGRLRFRGARVAVLGNGGAACAIVDGLRRRGSRVTIFGRNEQRAAELARRFGAAHLPWKQAQGFRCDLLVNATPVGMAPDSQRVPIPGHWVSAGLVYDMIYNPPETRFLRMARNRGAGVIGGVEMFLLQGSTQFKLFTGREAPIAIIRAAVLAALAHDPDTGGRSRTAAVEAPASTGRRGAVRRPARSRKGNRGRH